MLMSFLNAQRVVQGCQMVARVHSNGYAGKDCDVHTYTGKYGTGYTVTSQKITEYYVYPYTEVAKNVYDGDYDVSEAVDKSFFVRLVDWHGIKVKPTWKLTLDTISGKTTVSTTEDYTPITFSGHTLTVCWTGSILEQTLRRKIRRKMRELVNSGKAKLK